MLKKTIALYVSIIIVAEVFSFGGNYEVKAEDGNPVVSGSSVVQQTPSPELPEISAVSVESVKKAGSLKKVTVTWTAVNDAQGYYVMRRMEKGIYGNIATVTGTQYEDTSVIPGNTYYYQVVAFQNVDGVVRTGVGANEKKVALVPGKVKGLKIKRKRKKFIVTWKKTSGIDGYQVYTKVFTGVTKTKYGKVKTLKGRKYIRRLLVRGMKYGFKVRAYKKVNGKNIYGAFATKTKRY